MAQSAAGAQWTSIVRSSAQYIANRLRTTARFNNLSRSRAGPDKAGRRADGRRLCVELRTAAAAA